jgi:hypothetical protein
MWKYKKNNDVAQNGLLEHKFAIHIPPQCCSSWNTLRSSVSVRNRKAFIVNVSPHLTFSNHKSIMLVLNFLCLRFPSVLV